MKIATYEGTVENGQIKLSDVVELPEHARVYVVVPDSIEANSYHVGSPRLAHPEHAGDFDKEVIEESANAGLR
jgi:hypothetical protein